MWFRIFCIANEIYQISGTRQNENEFALLCNNTQGILNFAALIRKTYLIYVLLYGKMQTYIIICRSVIFTYVFLHNVP